MKNTVLKYGTIAGLVAVLLLVISTFLEKQYGYESTAAEILSYVGVLAICVPLYLGVRSYRETVGEGYITFLKGLSIGIYIIVISCLFYAISYLIIYYWLTPDFPDKYSAFLIQKIKTAGINLKDTAAIRQDTLMVKKNAIEFRNMTQKPLIFGAYQFIQPLQVGILMALVCAGILRKKPPTVKITTLN